VEKHEISYLKIELKQKVTEPLIALNRAPVLPHKRSTYSQ
jgi:hypothetical protein